MMQVWRFPLGMGENAIAMPKDAKVTHFGFQGSREQFSFWAVLDPNVGTVVRTFAVVGTGHDLPDGEWEPVGSAIMQDGFHVWHLLEEVNR